jgi:hypothetical protein
MGHLDGELKMRHNKYHNHEFHSCNPQEVYYDNHHHEFPKVNCKRSCTYKTYGSSNPYYKCVDYYLLNHITKTGVRKDKRAVHRCALEDYIETFIGKGFKNQLDPNINTKQYYQMILVWLKAAYKRLMQLGVTYSNLNERDSATLVIRRVLSKYVCEEEMCRIGELFNLNLNKTGEQYLNC